MELRRYVKAKVNVNGNPILSPLTSKFSIFTF